MEYPRNNFDHKDMRCLYLRGQNLVGCSLIGANLSEADLQGANLSRANLKQAQLEGANLTGAILTGACIQDWQIGSSTNLEGIRCDYIFRRHDIQRNEFDKRLPVDLDKTFAPREFEKWIEVRKGALDTIDITFIDGIDWQAFFRSLDTIRRQRPEAGVRMQSVQEVNNTYVASLQLETEIVGKDLENLKAICETVVNELYEKLKNESNKQIAESLQLNLEKILNMGSKNVTQYFQGDNFGNIAGANYGEMTATIHNKHGVKANDILQLLTALRESAQSFPDEHRETAQLQIEDLTRDLAQSQQNPARLKTRFVALLTVAIALGTHVATATDFANNVLELSQKLSVPAQALQPQLQQLKQIHPGFKWTPTE